MLLSRSSIFLLVFPSSCSVTCWVGVMKSPPRVGGFWICLCLLPDLSVCFTYFPALLLAVHSFIIAIWQHECEIFCYSSTSMRTILPVLKKQVRFPSLLACCSDWMICRSVARALTLPSVSYVLLLSPPTEPCISVTAFVSTMLVIACWRIFTIYHFYFKIFVR